MPVESPPERGAIWLDNWILSSTLPFTPNQQTNYPGTNLLNPFRSDRWWSTDTGDRFVWFDLGSVKLPTCFALVDSNIDSGTFLQLAGGDDAAMTTNVVAWYLPLYKQDATGRVLRWYLGTPSGGPPLGSGRRFWRVGIYPSLFSTTYTTDPFYKIGVVWLGQYVAIRPWDGIRIRPKDPSLRTLSTGRATWSDPKVPYREASVPLGGLTMAQFYDLEAKIRPQGTTHALLDVHAFSTDPILKRGGALYGTFTDDPFDGEISSLEDNSVTLSFEEASG